MNDRRRQFLFALLVLSAAIPIRPAHGQTILDGFDDGLRPESGAGSFVFFPDVEATAEYTDKVFQSESDPIEDAVLVARPGLVARSGRRRHSLQISYSGEYGSYLEYGCEDPRVSRLQASGRLDVTATTTIAGDASFAAQQEGRGGIEGPGDVGAPSEYRTFAASGDASRELDRPTVALRGGVTGDDYDDVVDTFGDVTDNDDRDATTADAGLRLAYEASPATTLDADVARGARDDVAARDDNGYARAAGRWTAALGMSFDPTPIPRGEISIGRGLEDYDDDRFHTVVAATLDASLKWAVTSATV